MKDKKGVNPKDAIGGRKAPISTVSAPVIMEMALGLLEGACKYRRHNYRRSPIRGSVYYDAAIRHLMAWWEGEDIDPDSGLNHITKAMSCLAVIRDAQINGTWHDDRPPKAPEGWMKELNRKTQEILDRFPEPLPPHTEIDE